jgi:flagellar basal-body rod modification protein FlgD
LSFYDVSGRLVRTMELGRLPAGDHSVPWDARDDGGERLASGSYLVRLEAAGSIDAKQLILLK